MSVRSTLGPLRPVIESVGLKISKDPNLEVKQTKQNKYEDQQRDRNIKSKNQK